MAAAAALAAAAVPVEGRGEVPGEYRVHEENDFFNFFTGGTDRYYTQGLRVERLESSWEADADFLPGIEHFDWCSVFCGPGADAADVNTGYAFGQSIYTPADITIAAPQPFDRPWGGLLYGARIARVTYPLTAKVERQDRIEVLLGVVGPASLAKQAQIRWHEVIGADRPAGWANQLRNEPIAQLHYETALRWHGAGDSADLIPRMRADLGNALVSLAADVTARVGWNLSGFGVSPILAPPPPPAHASVPATDGSARSATWLASGNLFARAGVKAVAHDIFLDGNTFARSDIGISRTPLVPELAAGMELNLVARLWVTFQFVHRGSQFAGRRGRAAPAHGFGSVTVAWMFGS